MIWFSYAAAWVSTAAATIAGLYFTGLPWCLWAMIAPLALGWPKSEVSKDGESASESDTDEMA